MRQVASALWPKLRALQIYGANTGVGKTVFSTILCRVFQRHGRVHYLKPVSTGPLDEADDRHILDKSPDAAPEHPKPSFSSRCLFQFSDPVSPHIAARSSPVSDNTILEAIYDELRLYAKDDDNSTAIVETAGGVLSPVPSGNSQADLYRPLRLPVLLIGDHQLGGIGTTISAWESLLVRGYDVHSVALFEDDRYKNYQYLRDYFRDRGKNTVSIEQPPERHTSASEDARAMSQYYTSLSGNAMLQDFARKFIESHEHRVESLQQMPRRADKAIWHPFMQHSERSEDTIVAMDSAYGDHFQTWTTKQTQKNSSVPTNLLKPAFDASASWWTQGLGHGNPELALTAAYAAGRYGHVMFAGAVHEPALTLAETLVRDMGNAKLAKVFYTDNGSTGMEVAVKMALRSSSLRYGWDPVRDNVQILGLKGSYHGDTIGTMDCSEPSIYNQKVEWYRGRGHWLDFPEIKMRDGEWRVEIPSQLTSSDDVHVTSFESLDGIFDLQSRRGGEQWKLYETYINNELDQLARNGVKLGALIMEPIILGAGGMLLADPLFQRCLIDCVRSNPNFQQMATATSTNTSNSLDWQGLPVIFDEVFTGLYRLGRYSAASFLNYGNNNGNVQPDIVVNAKLLTGGLLPLCTTTASEAIFSTFLSADKSDALLHGHSYTAHAVGCAVANKSLEIMGKIDREGKWEAYRRDWKSDSTGTNGATPVAKTAHAIGMDVESQQQKTWSMWSRSFVTSVSHKSNVDYVFALGSVMAISLRDPAGSGYSSTAATGLRDTLFAGVDGSGEDGVVHSRVLGNVLYLMAAMTTERETLKGVEEKVMAALG